MLENQRTAGAAVLYLSTFTTLHHFSQTPWKVPLTRDHQTVGGMFQPLHHNITFGSVDSVQFLHKGFLLKMTLECHLNNRVTRVFARLARQRGLDGFCHLSEINNNYEGLYSERHDYLASQSRKVQSWPLANNVFCGFVLAHFNVQQQQQHLKQPFMLVINL